MSATGRTVADNIRRARGLRAMTQAELSARLSELGRPIPVASVGKIEKGLRAVEVDDLMVIALALNVSPLGLLLPGAHSPEVEVEVTGATASASLFWRWALAEFSPDDDERKLAAMSLPSWLTDVGGDVKLPKAAAIEFYWGYGDGETVHMETHRTD